MVDKDVMAITCKKLTYIYIYICEYSNLKRGEIADGETWGKMLKIRTREPFLKIT